MDFALRKNLCPVCHYAGGVYGLHLVHCPNGGSPNEPPFWVDILLRYVRQLAEAKTAPPPAGGEEWT